MKTDNAVAARTASQAADAVVPQMLTRIPVAAKMLGISVDSFERWVEPDLKIVRIGRMKLVPTIELERFIEREAHKVSGVS